MDTSELKEYIKTYIVNPTESDTPMPYIGRGHIEMQKWLLNPELLTSLTNYLYQKISHLDNYQLAGVETASFPLLTSLLDRAAADGKTVTGFYIRRSRKKSGRYLQIEGEPRNTPVILVDDVINSGLTALWAKTVLEKHDLTISHILTTIQYHENSYYSFLTKNTKLETIFRLDDFAIKPTDLQPKINPYRQKWVAEQSIASHIMVTQKSIPAVVGKNIYFGTDQGKFISLYKDTGKIAWEFVTGVHDQQKNIFSSPAVYKDQVFFGSYDGKFYALNKNSGQVNWVYQNCDWVGSSPCISHKNNAIYIGLEHSGPQNRRGSLAALDIDTGKLLWEFNMRALTHASPIYIKEHNQVAIGSNEGRLYLLDANDGKLIWSFETEGGQFYDGVGGFSPGDIKQRPVYDPINDFIYVASVDGFMYAVKRQSGDMVFRVGTKFYNPNVRSGIFGSPAITEQHVLFAATDKYLYCVDKRTGEVRWEIDLRARMFSTPVIKGGIVYIGTNNACLYEIKEETGEIMAVTQLNERITSPVIFDDDTLYVPTNDNGLTAFHLNNE